MFKKNSRHLQIPLTSHVDELPEPLRKRLHNSWAETFYHEFFCRLNEQPFEVLYVDFPSRPNVPVNVLMGLEFLKAANGWTGDRVTAGVANAFGSRPVALQFYIKYKSYAANLTETCAPEKPAAVDYQSTGC